MPIIIGHTNFGRSNTEGVHVICTWNNDNRDRILHGCNYKSSNWYQGMVLSTK